MVEKTPGCESVSDWLEECGCDDTQSRPASGYEQKMAGGMESGFVIRHRAAVW